ncbi:hypothetical protein OROGR_015004 [Orobanche gracilis]
MFEQVFVKPRTNKVSNDSKGLESGQGTAGVTRKPNKEILEHDRKRQIQLKLLVLEDKLIDQGYTDAEIAEKLDEARKSLEAKENDDGWNNAGVTSESGFRGTDPSDSCIEGKADGNTKGCSWNRI